MLKLIVFGVAVAVIASPVLIFGMRPSGDEMFARGARMGAYSTMKKYDYCLVRAQGKDLTDLSPADRFKECTRIISEDVDAICPSTP